MRDKVRLLTGVVENNMALIYAKDLDGRYLFYNGTFAAGVGLAERAAAEGQDASEVLLGRDDTWLDPDLEPVWRANDLRAREGSYSVEEWFDHPEQGRLFYDSIKFPLLDSRDRVYAVCGVSLDVTAHKQLAAQLRRERWLLAEAQAVGQVGSWEWDLATGEPQWSDQQFRLHGLQPGDSIPPPECFGELLHHDDRARVAQEMEAKFGRPEDFEVEYRVRHGAFGPRTLLISGGTVEVEGNLTMAGTCRDVTAEREVEQERVVVELELRRAARYFELSRDLIISAGFDGYFKQVNKAWVDCFGWSEQEMCSRPFLEFVHPDDRGVTDVLAADLAAGGTTVNFVNRYRAKDGTYRFLEWNAIGSPEEGVIYASARDTTERRLTERYIEARHEATRVLSEATTVDQALPVLLEAIGTRMDWPIGVFWVPSSEGAATELRCAAFWHESEIDPAAYRSAAQSLVLKPGEGLAGSVFETGRPRWVPDFTTDPDANPDRARAARIDGLHACVLLPILSGKEVVGVMEFVRPERLPEDTVQLEILDTLSGQVSQFFERERVRDELEHLSQIDPLTGLHNRRHMEEAMGVLLSAAERYGHGFAVLLVDIDHFKQVNDTHGHQVGDGVLCAIAETLTATLRTEDSVARWGGEEFLVALPEQDAEGAAITAERIRASVASAKVKTLHGSAVAVSVTIGGAVWAGDSVDQVIDRADSALYRGKDDGRDTVEIATQAATQPAQPSLV